MSVMLLVLLAVSKFVVVTTHVKVSRQYNVGIACELLLKRW